MFCGSDPRHDLATGLSADPRRDGPGILTTATLSMRWRPNPKPFVFLNYAMTCCQRPSISNCGSGLSSSLNHNRPASGWSRCCAWPYDYDCESPLVAELLQQAPLPELRVLQTRFLPHRRPPNTPSRQHAVDAYDQLLNDRRTLVGYARVSSVGRVLTSSSTSSGTATRSSGRKNTALRIIARD